MDAYERKMKSKVWIWKGTGSSWHFVTLPKKEGGEIRKKFTWVKRGWGSIPVKVVIGSSRWKTSIFPDKETNSYVLPLKKQIRANEKISEGDSIEFILIIENII